LYNIYSLTHAPKVIQIANASTNSAGSAESAYMLLPIAAIPKTKIHITTTQTQVRTPRPTAMKLNILAFLEASIAPAISPLATLLFTWVAKMIDTTPRGRQQNIVDRIAGIK
jgi:hypothetical protein